MRSMVEETRNLVRKTKELISNNETRFRSDKLSLVKSFLGILDDINIQLYVFLVFDLKSSEHNFEDELKQCLTLLQQLLSKLKDFDAVYNLVYNDKTYFDNYLTQFTSILNTLINILVNEKPNFKNFLSVESLTKKIENLEKKKDNLEYNIRNYNEKLDLLSTRYDEFDNTLHRKMQDRVNYLSNDSEHFLQQKIKSIREKNDRAFLEIQESFEKANIELEEKLNIIEKTSQRYSELVGIEATDKLTNEYRVTAQEEKQIYRIFTGISFLIIILVITFSYFSLSSFAEKHITNQINYTNLDLIYLSIRLIFSLLLFSTIGFTSRVAAKSYHHWKKNENIYLKLTALHPFIASMPKEKQQEISENLIDVYFGKEEQNQNINQKLNDLPDNITQLLGKVIEQTSVVLDSPGPKKIESSGKKNEKDE